MRLDKYLKVSRILKRRTTSKELASEQRVKINDKVAKASSEVKLGDIITIRFGYRILSVKVLATPKQTSKSDATLMFEVMEEIILPKQELQEKE